MFRFGADPSGALEVAQRDATARDVVTECEVGEESGCGDTRARPVTVLSTYVRTSTVLPPGL